MKKRMLGRSGIEVSPMGMGCWAIGGPWWMTDDDGERGPAGWGQVDDAESLRTIHRAIDLGVTLFDTAANYGCGHSERILGQAVSERRDSVIIATKFGHLIDESTREMRVDDSQILANMRQDCENSLRRLNTEYIDIYQLHAGGYDPVEAVAVRDVLEELVKEGKIRAYGWSTDDVNRAAVFAQGEHCVSIQHDLNVILDAPEMLTLIDEHNLTSINKTALFRGILTGKFDAESTFPEDDVRNGWDFSTGRGQMRLQQVEALRDVLAQGGRTLAQGALGWIWARSERTVPIPGARTVRQIEENAGAMDYGPLIPAQMQEIDHILERA